jgi:hypothetical protein
MKRPMHLYLVLCFSSVSALYGQNSSAERLTSRTDRVTAVSDGRTTEVSPFSVAAQDTRPVGTSEKPYSPQLSGTVVDTSGAVIARATVQVRSAKVALQTTAIRMAPSKFPDSRQEIIDWWFRVQVLKPEIFPSL